MTITNPMFPPPLVPAASPTSRRNILFGLAAAGVAASPAVASSLRPAVTAPAAETVLSGLAPGVAAASEVDPIFAAIEGHRAAWARYDETGELFQRLRNEEKKTTDLWGPPKGIGLGEQEELRMESFANDEGKLDWRVLKTGRIITVWTDSPLTIEMYAPQHLPDRQWRAWIRSKKADLHRAREAERAAQKGLPSSRAYKDWNEADRALNRATKQLMRAKFTSREGAGAALTHWAKFSATYGFEEESFLDAERNTKFLTNVVKALAKIEGARA
jgi:hypothetical protein